jgi:transposase InsO family protein
VPTPSELRRAELDAAVAEAFKASHGLHGSPRIHADVRGLGWQVSEKTVATSMARHGLVARRRKRRKNLTRPDKRAVPFPDLVKRDFTVPAPNVKWVGDMTEIPTDEGNCTWRRRSTCSPAGCSATPPAAIRTPNWLVRPSRWPPPPAAVRTRWPG